MKGLLGFYATRMKVELLTRLQYQLDISLQLIGKFVEPVIYLVVWTTIAQQSGGEVGGYTSAQFAGYYIAWTLVRTFTLGWNPVQMEWRIRRGDFNPLLLRPLHPIHEDVATMLSWNAIGLITLVPMMAFLTLLFRPELELHAWSVAAFIPALVLAFSARFVLLWAVALIAFWTTRLNALLNLVFAVEFLLSGRLVPLGVLPAWAQRGASFLPFKWMFGFPLELLIGRVPPEDVLVGFGIQALWLGAMIALLLFVWRSAVRRYAAVGG